MCDTQLDGPAEAERLLRRLHEVEPSSTLAVLLGIYCRHKRGEPPLTVTDAYFLANFKHGRITSAALEGAKKAGYITTDKPEGAKSSFLHPTDKLVELVQALVDIEAPARKVEEQHRESYAKVQRADKRFAEILPGLLQRHPNKLVTISCDTGRYLVHNEDDDESTREFARSLAQGDLVTTRVIREPAAA